MKINDIEFTLGADPEVFIIDTRDNSFVCAAGVIPGTKDKPFPVPNGMVQVDGFATEFGIKPAKTKLGFRSRIRSVRRNLDDIVKAHNNAFVTIVKPTAHFSKKTMDEAPAEAKVLGCDPDFNAYTGQPNPRPNADNLLFRTGGGHVHIGWTKNVNPHHPEHFEACRLLTKQLDLFLGVPSVLFDSDKERRKLYGAAGAFRPKSYGMEYRTLSNAWLKHDLLVDFVYDQTIAAITDLLSGEPVFYNHTNVTEVIHSSNVQSAYYLCDKLKFNVPKPPVGFSRKKVA